MARLKFIAVALFSVLLLALPSWAQTNIQNNPSEFLTKAFPALYNSNLQQSENNGFSGNFFAKSFAPRAIFTPQAAVTIVNYDFLSAAPATPCTATPLSTASGVTSAFSTNPTTCTTPAGTATTATAFTANASNQSVSVIGASGATPYFQFQLGGTSLSTYSAYKVYFQAQRSNTGPATGSLTYSTDGGTNFVSGGTFTNPTAFGAFNFDLSAVTALNGAASIIFRIQASGGTGGTFRVDNFQVQADNGVATGPTLSVNPTSLTFGNQTVNTTSAAQSYTLTGSNLTGDVTVTAPAGYAVSTTSGGTYSSTLTVTPTSGSVNQAIFVQFTPTSATTFSGNITNASAGATTQNVAVSGTGVAVASPTITVSTNTLTSFGSLAVGQVSAAKTYTVSGSNLTDNIIVTAPSTDFQVSSDGTNFSNSVTLTQTGGTVATTTISVRFTPQSAGAKSGNVTNSSTGATTQNVAVSGTGVAQPDLTITQSAPSSVASGGTLTYTLVVTNGGGAFTGAFDATFNLPASGYSNATVTSTGCFTGSNITGALVTLTGCPSLAANGTSTVTIAITPNATGTLTSGTATVDSGNAIAESNEANNTAAGVSTTVNAAPTGVVINEVYTAGGNTGATYNADYVELYNSGASTADLSGYSIQYFAAAGTSTASTSFVFPTGSTIAPGGYYLIQGAIGANGTAIPATIDGTSNLALGATAGNVLFVAGTANLANCTSATGANVIDKVGYGATAACFEGTAAAPTPTTTQTIQRIPNGSDTNQNSTDFKVLAPTPRAANVSPTLSVNPTSLTFGNQTVNTTSASQNYTLTGSNLTGDVTVTAPAGYAVSTTAGGTYTTSLTVTPTSGSVNQTIYVQFTPTSATTFSGNITNASAGATTQNVAVSGTGVAANNPPTITAAGALTRQQGTAASNSQVATVSDADQAANTLSVTATLASGSGVTISGIAIDASGNVTANVSADCSATNSTFTLTVTDNASATATATLTVNVTANTAPTLSYNNPAAITVNGSTTVNPATGPSDNGSVASIVVQSTGGYTGTISVNSAGVVSISNAQPTGTFTITIRATDNCGLTKDATFVLTVNGAPTNPSGVGAANPNPVVAGNNTLLTVTVTPGTNPASTGLTVTGNLSSIGGSTTQAFFDNGTNGDITAGDNVFSYNATVAANTTPGAKSLPISISDAQSRSGSTNISLTVNAANNPPTITAVNPTVNRGETTNNVTIANVTDDGGNGNVTVSVTSTNPSNGVTISNIVNTNGTIKATITATCSANNASFTLSASDGVNTAVTTTLNVTVTDSTVASQLAFVQHPTNTSSGAVITPAVTVQARNACGVLVSGFNGSVTVSLNGTGTLGGTTTVNAVNGVATFSNLTVTTSTTGSFTLTATSNGLTSATSNSFTVTALPNLTINDVTLNEGNSGTTSFTFTVNLSSPAPTGGVTFDIATANGTATAPSDYTAKSLTGQTIPAGSSTYSFTVLVNGDTTVEPDETFFVNVTNVTGANVTDGQGLGTITNDDTADTTPPVITYTPLPAKSTAGSSALTVTVTDNVAVSGVSITYQIGTNAAVTAACPNAGGTSYTCTIDETGGQGTTVKYRVSATDSSGNTSTNPTTGDNGYAIGSNIPIQVDTYGTLNLNSGGTLSGNIVVNTNLSNSGIINTGSFTLEIGCNATIFAGSSIQFVNGTIQKDFCAPQTFTFPVGNTQLPAVNGESQAAIGGYYAPVTANVTAAVNPSSLTVSETDAFMPGADQTKSVSRYWTLTEGGSITANLSFTYNDADVNGDESLYKVIKNESGATTSFAGSTNNPATNTATVTGITNFSLWSVGALNGPSAASASVSGRVRAGNLVVSNAQIMVSGGNLQQPLVVRTNNFGYYSIDGLESGQTYVLTIVSKRYTFQQPSIVVNTTESLTEINFDGMRRQ